MSTISPREALARFARHFAAGEYADALAVVDALLETLPGEATLQFQRARVLAQLERADEARAAVKAVLAAKPGHAGAWALRAEVGEREDIDYDPEPDLRRAIALDPRHPRARYLLAMALRDKDVDEEARTQLDTSIALDPRMHEALALRGSWLRADSWSDPESHSDPEAQLVTTVHGLRFRKSELEHALGDVERAIAIKAVPQYLYQRADILHALGRYDEAGAAYQALFDELPPGHALREPAMLGVRRTERGGAGEREEIATALESALTRVSAREKEVQAFDQAAAMMRSAAHGIRQGRSVTDSMREFVSDSPEEMAAVSIAWQIRQLAEEPVPDYAPADAKQFPAHQRAWAKSCDRSLAKLGFDKLGNLEPLHLAATLARKQMLSLYLGDHGAIVAAAFSMRPKWPGLVAWLLPAMRGKSRTVRVIELESALTDGTVISTSNMGGANPYENGPHFLAEKHAPGTRAARLLERHRARVADYLATHFGVIARELRTLEQVSEQQALQTAAKNAYRRSIGFVSDQELKSLMGPQYDEFAPRVRAKLRSLTIA